MLLALQEEVLETIVSGVQLVLFSEWDCLSRYSALCHILPLVRETTVRKLEDASLLAVTNSADWLVLRFRAAASRQVHTFPIKCISVHVVDVVQKYVLKPRKLRAAVKSFWSAVLMCARLITFIGKHIVIILAMWFLWQLSYKMTWPYNVLKHLLLYANQSASARHIMLLATLCLCAAAP